MTITQKIFDEIVSSFKEEKKLAVALSGGGDSMALAFLLSGFCKKHKIELHALTVDHGLRSESAKEAKTVGHWIEKLPSLTHKILKWTGDKPKTRIQEEARKARYALMSDYCRKQKIKYLFLAHHGDDQVETFLFRLAKGSGLDGLAVMPRVQEITDVTLVRPLLEFSHDDLIGVCKKNKLDWVEDPSNEAEKFARVRLRHSRVALEKEGLTTQRIVTLSSRLNRARNALEQLTEKAFEFCAAKVEPMEKNGRIEINLEKFLEQPDEIGLRLLQKSLSQIGKAKAYPPSLQILEEITAKIYAGELKAATLAGCIIRRRKRINLLEITREKTGE